MFISWRMHKVKIKMLEEFKWIFIYLLRLKKGEGVYLCMYEGYPKSLFIID